MTITNSERSIELSLHPLDHSGEATDYRQNDVNISDFENVFTELNYSPIIWKDSYRKSENYLYATGFCLDFDKGITIDAAEAILLKNNLNYFLCATKSHTPTNPRFRVFIPFNKKLFTYQQYLQAATAIDQLFGTKCDPSVFDAARQFFGSGNKIYFSFCWTREDYDANLFIGKELSIVEHSAGDWNDSLIVKNKNDNLVSVKDIKEKTSIYCPWHDDEKPSAFIEYSDDSKNWFIHCKACKKTFWKTKVLPPKEERCKGYWSHGKGIYELGVVGDEFYFKEIGEKKLYCNVAAFEKKDRDSVFQWIVKKQHLNVLNRIDHLGNGVSEKTTYEVRKDEGIIKVQYAPIPVKIKDNQFIENYLSATFKEHKDFIKEYLAGYCYTNYRPLPTLILVGKRARGKNKFAEAVGEIYKPLSTFWELNKDTFNPAYEKKLLIADETLTNDRRNYVELKRITGQSEHTVNKKFTPHYSVKNNINVIILSNRLLPIFVESSELPSSEDMNQFFVYEFPEFSGPVDAEIDRKLRERMGHYVRTVLLQVFQSMEMYKYRYGMKVPITDEERRLFNSSVSEEDELKDRFIQQLVTRLAAPNGWNFLEHVLAGYVPKELFGEFKYEDKEKRIIVRRMREVGYLSDKEPERVQAKGSRAYCYKMLDPMKKKIENDLGTGCFTP